MKKWLLCVLLLGAGLSAETDLKAMYEHQASKDCYCSDTGEHVSVLAQLAEQCESVVEIGLRDMVSTWGLLYGLANNSSGARSYLGIDLESPLLDSLNLAKKLSAANGVSFQFWQANDMDVDFECVDMLFIDSYHTYCHLTYELEKFSPHVRKFIAMHDTSEPWGMRDEDYAGNHSEYPGIDRTKRGLWPAVEDFLARHPEWVLRERRLNCHGLTTLERRG